MGSGLIISRQLMSVGRVWPGTRELRMNDSVRSYAHAVAPLIVNKPGRVVIWAYDTAISVDSPCGLHSTSIHVLCTSLAGSYRLSLPSMQDRNITKKEIKIQIQNCIRNQYGHRRRSEPPRVHSKLFSYGSKHYENKSFNYTILPVS